MIYTYSIEETYTPKAKRSIEIKNASANSNGYGSICQKNCNP